jgi:hypothetical protein
MDMNYDQMILAHSKWKTRLKQAIQGQEQVDVQVAAKDDQCELGKWIHGEGKKHANLSAYNDLKTKHARFHASIPGVVNAARSSTPAEALELLDPVKGEFGRASSDCINAITALKRSLT